MLQHQRLIMKRFDQTNSSLRQARWHSQVMQTSKGLEHLRRGVQRFVQRRPVVSAVMLLGGMVLVWQTFGGRS